MLVTRLSLLLVLISLLQVNLGNAKSADVVKTNLDSMCELQSENPFAPDQEYTGKIIEVQETVNAILENGNLLISDKSSDSQAPTIFVTRYILDCDALPRNQLAKLRPGDTIRIRGTYNSIEQSMFLCTVKLKSCRFENHLEEKHTTHSDMESKNLAASDEEKVNQDEDIRLSYTENEEEEKTSPTIDFFSPNEEEEEEKVSILAPNEGQYLKRWSSAGFQAASPDPELSIGGLTMLFIILGILSMVASYWNYYINQPLPVRPEIIRNPITNSLLAICSIATLVVVVLIFIKSGFSSGLVAIVLAVLIFWLTKKVIRSNTAKK